MSDLKGIVTIPPAALATPVKPEVKVHTQASAYDSPWTLKHRIAQLFWGICWTVFCSWTPKPLNKWRLAWLRLFGAKIHRTAFVHQRARIHIPWNLIMHERACMGDGAYAYTMGVIELKARSTVAQEVFLCTGTHDLSTPELPLVTAKITVESDAFVGARAFVLPGVTIAEGAVIGSCSVVSKDAPPWMICAGNPCKPIKPRDWKVPADKI